MSVSILSARSASSTDSSRSCLSAVSALSDRELLSRVTALARRERETTLSILLHLNEVYRRRLYLSLGYRSLFDYCVRHLGYSRSAAGRRFQTARCLREFPEVYGMLEKGEVNLSTITLVASVLNKENKTDILDRIRGKSQEAVEGIVARFRPLVPQRDRVKPVCVRVPEKATGAAVRAGAEGTSETGTLLHNQSRSGTDCAAAVDDHSGNGTKAPRTRSDTPGSSNTLEILPETRLEEKLLIQFVASKGLMTKYNQICALLSNTVGKISFETVFEAVLDDYIERHSPRKRAERRKKRQERATKNGSATPVRPARTKAQEKRGKSHVRQEGGGQHGAVHPGDPQSGSTPHAKHPHTDRQKRSRHIPTALRDKVFMRDQGKCTYVGHTGKRCGSTHGLHIDHIVPYARGGTHVASNLRLLCAQHNRLEAERLLGASITRRYRRQE